ncbi:hypothetical protein GEMRC1_008496 [Eukaryota sp. GEM-RC1]
MPQLEGVKTLANGSVLEGTFVDGKLEGHGVLKSDSFTYTGGFTKGVMNGHGQMVFKTGKKLEGHFNGPFVEGTGSIVWPNGDHYFGQLKDNVPHGDGIKTLANGGKIEGKFVLGKLEGHSSYTSPSFTYIGSFLANLFDGEGQIDYSDGRKYTGLFRYGKKHGFGRYEAPSGTYEGFFVNDLYHGKGKFTSDSGVVYEGVFVEGAIEGHGTVTWPEGVSFTGLVREGDCIEQGKLSVGDVTLIGRFDSTGNLIGNGDRLIGKDVVIKGNHENGIITGFGTFSFPKHNCIYEGDVINDVITGEGSLAVKRNNEQYFVQGDFVSNSFVCGTIVYPSGSSITGQFSSTGFNGPVEAILADENDPERGVARALFKFEDGKCDSQSTVDILKSGVFEGQISDGSNNGSGIRVFENGDQYSGTFLNGLFHGDGSYVWADGSEYIGEFGSRKNYWERQICVQ